MKNIEDKPCKYCSTIMSDFRVSVINDKHFYCPKCKAHYYRDKWWDEIEWETMIEDDYQKKLNRSSKL